MVGDASAVFGDGGDGASDARLSLADSTVGGDVSVCDVAAEPKVAPCVLDDTLGVFVARPTTGGKPPDNDAAANAGADDGGILDGAGAGDAASDGARGASDGSTDASDALPPSGGTPVDGTMAHPYATIGAALAGLRGKNRVYVCNGLYDESIAITTSVALYGGLSCAPSATGRTWRWGGGVVQVLAPPVTDPAALTYPLSIVGTPGPVTIEDLSFTAPDAVVHDVHGNGASSVAAFVSGADVHLIRVALNAGIAASGANGVTGPSNYQLIPGSAAYAPGGVSGNADPISGPPGAIVCNFKSDGKTPDSSSGGLGGSSPMQVGSMLAGQPGTSFPLPTIVAGAWTTPHDGAGTSMQGDPGADGVARLGGAAAAGLGALSPFGWVPNPGGDGPAGRPGQGGGGSGACDGAGASGGAGGCGGAGGSAGGAGGASIALIVEGGHVSLTQCTLATDQAGTGGVGGTGQDGESGGYGAGGLDDPSCHASGRGGNGAGGSGGAGGTAGISVGILYSTGSAPQYGADTVITPGPGGSPGAGGASGAGMTAVYDQYTGMSTTVANPLGTRGSDGYTNSQVSSATLEVPVSP